MLRKPVQSLTSNAFLAKADRIVEEPRNRIEEPLRSEIFEDPDILLPNHAFFDVHAHSFSIDHIPRDFIKLLHWVSNQDKVNLLELISPTFGKFLGLREPQKVLETLIDIYDRNFAGHQISPKLFVVNLAMDMERGISGAPLFNYKSQVEQFLSVLDGKTPILSSNKAYEYRKTILPFIAIDPNNPDAYKYFLSAFIKDYNQTGISALDNSVPFVGVKLYPVLGYSPLDPVLLDIYQVCEAKKIPITTHCGGLRTRTNKRKVEIGQRRLQDGRVVDSKKVVDVSSKAKSKAVFVDPLHWQRVALEFPRLKLNLAHFGDNNEWAKYHKNTNDPKNFVFKTLKMIEQFPNVYADISYAYFEEMNRIKMAAMMKTDRYKNKILYGSDFYLTEVERFRTRDLLVKFQQNFEHVSEGYHLLTSKNPLKFLFDLS